MEVAVALAAVPVGFAIGWLVATWQHLLYVQDEYREQPASGKRRLALRLFAGAATAAVSALALRPDHYDAAPAALTTLFGLVLVVLASTDFERRIIPNRLSYPAIAAAAALSWAWPDRSVADIWIGLGFALAVAVVLFALGVAFGGAMGVNATAFGLGDVKLIGLIGLLVGWPAIMGALFIGVIAAGVPALVLIVVGGGRRVFSYGPYLALGGAIVLLWPERFV